MTPIEDAIRETLTARSTAAAPPLPAATDLVSNGRRRVRRVRFATALTAAVAVGTIAIASAAVATHKQSHSLPAVPRPTPTTFVAAESSDTKDGNTETKLEERSLADGHLVRLITTITALNASFALAPDGSILTAISSDSRCTADLERISRTTGARQHVRTINQSVQGLTISPDGRRIAFITYPACVPGVSAPDQFPPPEPSFKPAFAQASGPAGFLPNVLAVVDLANGRALTTASETPGHPFFGVSWSADGRELAVGYLGGHTTVLLMPAMHPDFLTARRVVPPNGCSYSSAAWTQAGLAVAKACGRKAGLDELKAIVQLNKAGVEQQSWPLPTCINGLGLSPDTSLTRLMAVMRIGYGAGQESPCADDRVKWADRTAVVAGDRLRTVIDRPPYEGFAWVGW